jgi:putative FmdB family regulatory protein
VPLYEYECDACGRRFEVIRKFSDPPLDVCKECGKGPVHKLLSSPAIQFKGSGWYITDYAKKGTDASSSAPAGKTGDASKADSGGTDTSSSSTETTKSDTTKSETSKTETSKAETKSSSNTSAAKSKE